MNKIIEALKVSAITMVIIVSTVSAILFLNQFIYDHFGLIAAYVFLAVVLFGVIFLSVWASLKYKEGGDEE